MSDRATTGTVMALALKYATAAVREARERGKGGELSWASETKEAELALQSEVELLGEIRAGKRGLSLHDALKTQRPMRRRGWIKWIGGTQSGQWVMSRGIGDEWKPSDLGMGPHDVEAKDWEIAPMDVGCT
jgi:hypothetical protein